MESKDLDGVDYELFEAEYYLRYYPGSHTLKGV
jgi:hypothetical protein